MLAERQRADEAQRDAKDERRIRSLAPLHSSVSSQGGSDDAAALRRELKLASSEIEALRTHNKDLRNQIQSGWWSWQNQASLETVPDNGGSESASVGGEARFLDCSSSGACAAAEAALREIGVIGIGGRGGGGGGCDAGGSGGGGGNDSNAAIELDRLSSLLAERDAQVSVLTSTVEALHTLPALVPSPRKSVTAPSMGDKVVAGDTEADDGGVGVLNHIGAQGLARRCVSLTVRLTSVIAREGKAQRRADRLADETARQARKIRAAKAVEVDLTRRISVLDKGAKKTTAALSGLRTESAARLREAGEEASKLR